jgi:hypothetical protein
MRPPHELVAYEAYADFRHFALLSALSREVEERSDSSINTGWPLTIQASDKAAKQPTDLLCICQQDSLDVACNQPDIPCDNEESLQLAWGSVRDGQPMLHLRGPKMALTLRDVGRNGDGRATQLARETESLVSGTF